MMEAKEVSVAKFGDSMEKLTALVVTIQSFGNSQHLKTRSKAIVYSIKNMEKAISELEPGPDSCATKHNI